MVNKIVSFLFVASLFACNSINEPKGLPKDASGQRVPSTVSDVVQTAHIAPKNTVNAVQTAHAVSDTPSGTPAILTVPVSKDWDIQHNKYDKDKDKDTLDGTRISRDTLIPISEKQAILYREYNGTLGLWYKPYIVNFDKKDTIEIPLLHDDDYNRGSELYCGVSPNLRYVILDYIDKGYAVPEDGEPFLHDKYYCVVADVKNANFLRLLESTDCAGEWDEKNNFTHRRSGILFDSEEYEREN
ncbi:MAG: hypothetical protein FWB85_09660 [Chitinispirillia bacterium]|nr:hypothetical protein [Chitinispirillia bacterium]MCL2242446.1 hypothetical protein [Chitinispirillia bacterium]